MAHTYETLRRLFETARSAYDGKPIGNNTRIFERGSDCLAIRHHDTDILTFHPDGQIIVDTSWSSKTTLERLYEYANIRVYKERLPTMNGYRPNVESMLCLHYRGQSVYFSGRSDCISIAPDGKIDMATVMPLQVGYIRDPSGLRRMQNSAKTILMHIKARTRVSGMATTTPENCFEFLLQNADKDPNEVIRRPLPQAHRVFAPSIWELAFRHQRVDVTKIQTPHFV